MQNNPLSISFCPTGMVPKKTDNPYVPVSPKEIAEEVRKVAKLGITSVHLHARDEEENPTSEVQYFREIIERIRDFDTELVLCVTTSGRNVKEFEKRSAVLYLEDDVKPDMASLTLSSLNFAKSASENSPDLIQRLAALMLEKNIKPECEIFDLGMLNYMKYLINKGLLQPPFIVNLILGNVAGAQADPATLGLFLNGLPDNTQWHVGGIGDYQLIANTLAIASGGGVRVGLEDNIYFSRDRKKLATNFELVERIHLICELLNRRVMSPIEFRAKNLSN